MIPRTVKTIYEGAGVKGIKRAPKEVIQRIADKLNLAQSPAPPSPFYGSRAALRPQLLYTGDLPDKEALMDSLYGQTVTSARPRVVMKGDKAFLVLHRGVSSGGKEALAGSNYQGKWSDRAAAPGFPATTDKKIARQFAGNSPTQKRKNHSGIVAMPGQASNITSDPALRARRQKTKPDLAPSSRGRWRYKNPRPNVGTYLLPEDEIEKAWVRPIASFGPEWEVRHPQVGDHLVRNKKYYSAKLRLREFSALRKRIRVKWHSDGSARMTIPNAYGGVNEIGRIETSVSSQRAANVGQVKWVEIDPKFRGMGLATKMYGEAMKGAPRGRLVSDNAQYGGGYGVWNKLQRNKGYKIRENPKIDGAGFDDLISRDGKPMFIGRINPAARKQSNLSAKLRLRELARGDYAIPALGKMLKDRSLLEEFLNGKRGPKLGDIKTRQIHNKDVWRERGRIRVGRLEYVPISKAIRNVPADSGEFIRQGRARDWAAQAIRRGRAGGDVYSSEGFSDLKYGRKVV